MDNQHANLSTKILVAIFTGLVFGVLLHILQPTELPVISYVVETMDVGGKLFLNFLKMLVVPLVFISLICGTFNLHNASNFGRTATKTIGLYLLTTSIAITLAITVAHTLGTGKGLHTIAPAATDLDLDTPSIKSMLIQIIPDNPVNAMAQGNMIQLIFFALMLGLAIMAAGERAERLRQLFRDADIVVMNLVHMVFKFAPYGIFCLVASLFSQTGLTVLAQLAEYFIVVVFVLIVQLCLVYFTLLYSVTGLSPLKFIQNMWTALLFAFSTSSSNASIPIVLDTVENKLGVDESVASFVIPLGATINMDGTAIMQGVATVFIANIYQIPLGLTGYATVVLLATMASIGTAGVPGVGLITLTMVLNQVGVPAEGIGLIIGIDRLLDMLRTMINISGDATIACVDAHSEGLLDKTVFEQSEPVNQGAK